jgi:3'(2'), 5'-bisphosphate nucleotidase
MIRKMRHSLVREEELPALRQLLRAAGAAILAHFGAATPSRYKADASPVTAADLAAQEVLAAGLKERWPTRALVSEEAEAPPALSGDPFWLIDPLDGTKEFLAGTGEFTVNLALIAEGRAIFGLVYAPALDLLYWGGSTLGAFCEQGGKVRAIATTQPHRPLRVVASKSHLNDTTAAFIHQLGEVTLIQAGSSLKFCRIAEGAADCYPRLAPTYEWDTAAAQAVLEGAGGQVLDLTGKPLRYGKPAWRNAGFVAWGTPSANTISIDFAA